MGDIVQSILSVQSVGLQSRISVLSVAAHPTPTSSPAKAPVPSPTSSPTPSSTPSSTSSPSLTPTSVAKPTPKSIQTSSSFTSTPSTSPKPSPSKTASHTKASPTTSTSSTLLPTNTPVSNAKSGGLSGGVVAVIVIMVLAAVAGAGVLFWLWRKRQRASRRDLWLESPAYLGNPGSVAESGKSRPTTYVFGGTGNIANRDSRNSLPPPPPPKEPVSPRMSQVHDGSFPEQATISIVPPTPTGESGNPYYQAQGVPTYPAAAYNASSRPDSGPMLIYSTPKTDDYTFGVPIAARPPSAISTMTSKTFPNPHPRLSQHIPPMPTAPTQAGANTTTAVLLPTAFTTAPEPVATASPQPPAPAWVKIYPVIRTYIPTLLDELRVSVGDRVRVVNEYDDGWAYCERVGDPEGTAGVVPIECLDRSGDGRPASPAVSNAGSGAWRASSRMSSFHVDFDAVRASRTG